ncbi:hypothetical protein KOR42_29310 [Thalassoglobus neptunius]|uniref:Uncharacterized protein n=1 Tax=Thalassoglobus neptunius TaxID=1938619 RepID=A0A5C5WZI6_9PLAN|nr:hypothetical protein KOR42_29310 [Thalassoglobus neptunius]
MNKAGDLANAVREWRLSNSVPSEALGIDPQTVEIE